MSHELVTHTLMHVGHDPQDDQVVGELLNLAGPLVGFLCGAVALRRPGPRRGQGGVLAHRAPP